MQKMGILTKAQEFISLLSPFISPHQISLLL